MTATTQPSPDIKPTAISIDNGTWPEEVAEQRDTEPEISPINEDPPERQHEADRSLLAAAGVMLVAAAGIGWAVLKRRK